MIKNDFYYIFSILRYLNLCLDFVVMLKNCLIRKLREISKFMTSKPGKQTITIHILPNISRSKGNQTTKFGHLYNVLMFFLKTLTENGARRLVPDLFLLHEKVLYEVKSSGVHLSFNIFNSSRLELPLLLQILGNRCMVIICFFTF